MNTVKNAAIIFGALAVLSMIATEIARSFVDRARVRRRGIGGTQDINLISLGLTITLWTMTVFCLLHVQK